MITAGLTIGLTESSTGKISFEVHRGGRGRLQPAVRIVVVSELM